MPPRPSRFLPSTLLWAAGLSFATFPAWAESSTPAAQVAALVPALERYVAALQQREEIPGIAIVIAQRDRLLYAKGFGVREAGKPAPVTPDTVFQIGSATKSFLATTVAMAVDAGKLAWDTPLAQRQPGFRLQDPWITQRVSAADVLSHGIGLQSYVYDDMIFLGYGMPARLNAMAHAPLTGTFRRSGQYVNLLHPLVGDIAAQAVGSADWDHMVTERIFQPLRMASSSTTREGLLGAANHAVPHQHIDGKLQAMDQLGGYWYREGFGPAGSINSSAQDMGQWLRLQLGRGEWGGQRLVSQAAMDETWLPRVMLTPTEGVALGWGVIYTPRGRTIQHEGGTASFGSVMMLLPDAPGGGLGIAVLSNHAQERAPLAIARWFADRIWNMPEVDYRAGFQREPAPPAPAPDPQALAALPATADAYAGHYASPTLGPVTVRYEAASGAPDGQLVLQLEQVGARLRLVPLGGHRFSAEVLPEGRFRELVAEGFTPMYQLAFDMAPDGKAASAQAVNPLQSRHDLVRRPP